MSKKYFIKTFGCQMNYSDSERIASLLEMHGFKYTENIKKADLAIFNTCGVRQMAEDRVYGQVHNIKKQETRNKKQNLVVLTGCLAERKDVQRRLKDKVDLFCGIKEFPKKIRKLIDCHPETRNDINYLSIIPKHNSSFSAFVPVMTGCNNFCSYCVVPYARGREVSRPADEIMAEIKNLIKQGYKMITLLGQNVNSYKTQIHKTTKNKQNTKIQNINFPKLLGMIDNIPGDFWITFLTSHPKDMSDELIEAVTRSKKVLEFVHLPIQAGSDKVLEKMNRKYTAKRYLSLIAKIKKSFAKHKPDAFYGIAGDIIVGFPGETRQQFLETAKVMEKVDYDMVYFGQFSPRYGTAAAKMKDNVSKKEKERRENFLNEILKKTALANNQKYLGKTMDVLIESGKNGFYFGRTRTMKNIKLPVVKKNLIGKIIKVKITKVNIWNLEGEIL